MGVQSVGMTPIRVALTCDDAPTIYSRPGGIEPDPARLDRVRQGLREHGVRHCVAFVVGRSVLGQREPLVRWLEAGYELGNHTFQHLAASGVNPAEFLADVARCDQLLASIGAFAAGRPRLFRFPYLDRGPSPQARLALTAEVKAMGYTIVSGTVDFYDHLYEEPLARALAQGQQRQAQMVEARYLETACRSVAYRARWIRRTPGPELTHIALFHAGLISPAVLPRLLDRMARQEVVWSSLTQALAHPFYRRAEEDLAQTGLIDYQYRSRTLAERVKRKLVEYSCRLNWMQQDRFGPCWPYLA